jgi:hypothetical protein
MVRFVYGNTGEVMPDTSDKVAVNSKPLYEHFETVSLTLPVKEHRSISLRKGDDYGYELTLTRHHFGGVSIHLNPEEVAWLKEHLPSPETPAGEQVSRLLLTIRRQADEIRALRIGLGFKDPDALDPPAAKAAECRCGCFSGGCGRPDGCRCNKTCPCQNPPHAANGRPQHEG